jgi:hypothetical protein
LLAMLRFGLALHLGWMLIKGLTFGDARQR